MAKILLVDDDHNIADELKLMLENNGHIIVTVSDGTLALREFEDSAFDCVISDIIMPDMDGIEIMLEMRRRKPDAKIIMVSGGGVLGKDEFLNMAAKLGAAATIRKPIDANELLRALNECLSTKAAGAARI